jgi:hypothetical protein
MLARKWKSSRIEYLQDEDSVVQDEWSTRKAKDINVKFEIARMVVLERLIDNLRD